MKKFTLSLTTLAALVAFSSAATAAGPGEAAASPSAAAAPAAQPVPAPALAAAPGPAAAAPAPQPQAAPYPGYVPEEDYYEEEEVNPHASRRERKRQRREHAARARERARGPMLPPAHLPYHENAAPPPGYVVQETNIRPLVIGGAVSLAVPYLVGLTAAVVTDFDNHSGWLAIPVVGPWVARESGDRDNKERRVALGVDGIVQGAGAVMLIAGLSITKKELVRNDLAKNLWIAPTRTANNGYGLTVGGQF